MEVLSRLAIEQWIVPFLPVGSRGFEPTVPLYQIVQAILYRLKTGCQWRQLPLTTFFANAPYSWSSVYRYFNDWSKQGVWTNVWIHFLQTHRSCLDLSCASLDGSQTPAKNGGEAVCYQGRKACKTTNGLFICDNKGVMLVAGSPQAGNHNDLYEIRALWEEMCVFLRAAGVELDGLFLNADAGFDSAALKELCAQAGIFLNVKPNPRNSGDKDKPYESGTFIFDEVLYKKRASIERANGWLDAFKALLVRFETKARNWLALHYIAFLVIFFRKINHKNKV